MSLEKANVHIPLSNGMDTRAGEFALEAPKHSVLENAVFDDTGEIKKRNGTTTKTNSVVALAGAGALTNSDNKAVAANKNQLLLFSNNRAYTWSAKADKWRRAWLHESCIVSEEGIVGDVEKVADRAVDMAANNGITVVCTADNLTFYDDATGSVVGGRDISARNAIRVKARPGGDQYLQVFLSNNGTGNIELYVFDTEDIAGTLNGAAVHTYAVGSTFAWDVDGRGGTGASTYLVAETGVGDYDLVIYNDDGTSPSIAAKVGKTTQDHIAVSALADGSKIGVARYDGTNTRVDLLDSSGTDVASRVNLLCTGGAPSAITAVYVDNTDDDFYVYVQKTASTTALTSPTGTAGGGQYIVQGEFNETLGTVNVYDYLYLAEIMTRAAESADNRPRLVVKHTPRAPTSVSVTGSARVYLTNSTYDTGTNAYTDTGDPTELQTCFFLMDGEYPVGDANPVQVLARVLAGEAFDSDSVIAGGSDLRNLQEIGGSIVQTILPTEARGDRKLRFDFSDLRAYRAVEVGESTYLPGGILCHYDGQDVREAAPLLYPENITHEDGGTAGPWGVDQDTNFFVYAFYWVIRNIRGEIIRSTNAGSGVVYYKKAGATTQSRKFYIPTVPYTRYGKNEERMFLEVYRSQPNPTAGLDAPRNLASQSPIFSGSGVGGSANVGSDNIIYNDPTSEYVTWQETVSGYDDDMILLTPPDPFQAGALDHVPTRPCKALASGQNRIFYLGPEDDNTIYYSKLRSAGEIAAFNEALAITVPSDTGGVRAVYPWEDKVVAFTERGVYVVPGVGPDNLGNGDYGLPRRVDNNSGTINELGLAPIPGGLIFKGDRGWYAINRGEQVQYIGGDVEDFNPGAVTSCVVVPDQHQVIVFSGGTNTLVYDWLIGQWSNWPEIDAKGATLWQGNPVWVDESTGAVSEFTNDYLIGGTTGYGLALETAWIKVDQGLNGWGRNYWWELLGRMTNLGLDGAKVRVRVAYNYDDTWRDDVTFDISSSEDDPLRIRYRFKGAYAKCAAVKFRVEDVDPTGIVEGSLWSNGFTLSGLSLQIGMKQGLTRAPALTTS